MNSHVNKHSTGNPATPLNEDRYGFKDTSFRAAGGYEGLQALVKCFYAYMETLPEAKAVRAMHADDLALIDSKLTHFLCYWLGGPRHFVEKHGPVSIPMAHKHLPIGAAERDAWLLCMEKAIARQPFKESFKKYLLAQLAIPAERIREVCATDKR